MRADINDSLTALGSNEISSCAVTSSVVIGTVGEHRYLPLVPRRTLTCCSPSINILLPSDAGRRKKTVREVTLIRREELGTTYIRSRQVCVTECFCVKNNV